MSVCVYSIGDIATSANSEMVYLYFFNINDKLTQYKINWREHIQRMDDNRLPKKKIKLQT